VWVANALANCESWASTSLVFASDDGDPGPVADAGGGGLQFEVAAQPQQVVIAFGEICCGVEDFLGGVASDDWCRTCLRAGRCGCSLSGRIRVVRRSLVVVLAGWWSECVLQREQFGKSVTDIDCGRP
jgi:hypothetical protein